jgi:hypothetical protein
MLKRTITSAKCRCEFDFMLTGSVIQDTNRAVVKGFRTHLEIESPEPEEVVLKIVRAAKRGCYAEQLIENPVSITSTYVLNGKPGTVDLADRD